ncbi:mucin-3B-like [Labeo rohita]|uniref:mucin-3B-like n=1 Tax=Labeo rohita TaxID=84645 RepID=UPI0021E32250|nr:mucin-3B-like [Labeo rohita]
MDYCLLLLIATSAVLEKTWCLNNSLSANNTDDNNITTINPLSTTVTEPNSDTTISSLHTTETTTNSITTISPLSTTVTEPNSITTISPLHTTVTEPNSITTISPLHTTVTEPNSITTISPLHTTETTTNSITTVSPLNKTVIVPNSNTTISPLNTTVTVPSLVCQNGGILLQGQCICNENWTGAVCNISNSCPEQKPTPFTFPKTVLGQFASSKEQCEPNTTNAGMHRASALCNRNTHLFDPPNILNCSWTLDTINAQVSGATVEEKQNLASSTQILTSIPERLTPHNITNAAQIASALLSDQQTAHITDITVSVVATVSQLLNASREIFSSVNNTAISELTQTLQEVSLHEEPNPLLVQPNMAVQTLKEQANQQSRSNKCN